MTNLGDTTPAKSVKWLEVPIQKFNDAVPHFVELLKTHQNNIVKQRQLNQWGDTRKEQTSATQVINQLESLLREMENLRTEVKGTDLYKFDRLICNSKQSAIDAIVAFKVISSKCCLVNSTENIHTQNNDDDNEELQIEQLVAVADLTEELKIQEQRAASMERLQEDFEDINYMFQELSNLVHHQGEAVEEIEEHVETTHHNVVSGEKMLCQAAKYKSGMYPLLGAFLGSVLGGPIGMVAGFKLGGLTAVGFGFLGFTGGKMLKNQGEVSINEAERYRERLKN